MDVVVGSASPPPESGRSSPSPTASPEFEFWMVGKNPGSFPSPALLTADQLFSHGIVLPLHTLQPPADPNADQDEDAEQADGDEEEDAVVKEPAEEAEGESFSAQPLAESCVVPTPDLPAVTFKWKDIFKTAGGDSSKDRSKTKAERRVSSVSGNSELININIWPFSRSRSAGHSATGAPAAGGKATKATTSTTASAVAVNASVSSSAPPAGRKVSSAPCSRSNSRGETSGPAPAPAVAIALAAERAAAAQAGPSMLRRLVPGGQGRAGALGASGIRLGRASPVWQLRRNKLQQQQAAAEQKQKDGGTAAKINSSSKSVSEDVATSLQGAAGEEEKTASGSGPGPGSVSAVAPTTGAACRNNAVCAEAGGEECIPPQGLFGLRRTFFSKKVY